MFNPPITGNKDLDAYLYDLSLNLDNTTNNTTEPDTPNIPAGDPGTYTYQYIQVKYAIDNVGTGFSDTPTNKTYFGIYNSDSSIESTNPADYTWYLSGFPFGTTYFLYYLILGGRKIKFAVDTSPPDYHWKVDNNTAIDLDTLVPSSTISANEIMDAAVTGLKIAANAVTATKLNVAALDQAFGDLRPNTVSAAQIATGAVSELKLLDGAVTAAKTAVAAINPSTGNLAANSVVASNIQAGTITGDKISANTITGNNIAALTIGAQAIAAQAITSVKIEAGAVTADKISVGSLSALSANLGTVTAGTITAGMIQSGTTGTYNGGTWTVGNAGITMNGFSGVQGIKTTTTNRWGLLAFQEAGSSDQCAAIGASTVSNGAFAVAAWGAFDANYNSFYTAAGVGSRYQSFVGRYNRNIGFPGNMSFTPVNTTLLNNSDNSGYFAFYGNSASNRIVESYIANTTTVSSYVGRRYDTSGSTLLNEINLNNGSYSAISNLGSIYSAGGYLPFTGVHDGLINRSVNPAVGDIVVDKQLQQILDDSNVVMLYDISSKANQKGIIGVCSKLFDTAPSDWDEYETLNTYDPITNKPEPGEPVKNPMYYPIEDNQQVIHINAVGEGVINVCGENGNIEIGDLIVTSSIPGKGMKQSDDIVRSITVAKSRENITFNSLTEIKQIACIYLAG